jgi:sulfotransferase
MVKSLIDGYYQDVEQPVCFNTNRAWTLLTTQIKHLYPKAKLIVCVRDINWVLNSFETAHRKYPMATNTVTGGPGKTVYDRVQVLMEDTGVVGFSYVGIKQAISGAERNCLMLVEYDNLCKAPKATMEAIYHFISEPYFNHDFNNVENTWDEYDKEIGIPLHQVRKKVEIVPRKFILPPDILNKYANMEVWRA